MDECAVCGKSDEVQPYTCNYCGLTHCGEHRLPENHNCAARHALKRPTTSDVRGVSIYEGVRDVLGSGLSQVSWPSATIGDEQQDDESDGSDEDADGAGDQEDGLSAPLQAVGLLAVLPFEIVIFVGSVLWTLLALPFRAIATVNRELTFEMVALVTILLAFAFAGAVAFTDAGPSLSGLSETDIPATGGTENEPTESSSADGDDREDAAVPWNRADTRTAFHARLNAFRAEEGRATLVESLVLVKAARSHSTDMADSGYFAHESPEGDDFQDRVRRQGGTCRSGGENIAQTWWREVMVSEAGPDYVDSPSDLADRLFAQWRTSEGHRRVMLLRGVQSAGLGLARDGQKVYATLVIC